MRWSLYTLAAVLVFFTALSCERSDAGYVPAEQDQMVGMVIEAGYKETSPPQYDVRTARWVTTVVVPSCTVGVLVESDVVEIDAQPRSFRIVHDAVAYRDSWNLSAEELEERLGQEALGCPTS